MSLDPAHSLRDSFDLSQALMDTGQGKPIEVCPGLSIQELDIQRELEENWNQVYGYASKLLSLSGLEDVVADEVAVLPGMEEVSSLLYINRYYKEETFDVVILDCAPTGESLRFISMPTTLEWYIKNVFRFERALVRTVRPFAKRLIPVPLPEDNVFQDMQNLFDKLDGIQTLLQNPERTSVRLVTNPEKMVLKETQRAYMYFCLYGLTIDHIIVNRLMPEEKSSKFVTHWVQMQRTYLKEIHERFAPTPVSTVQLLNQELLGIEGLKRFADELYGDSDPSEVHTTESPHRFIKENGEYVAKIRLPFVAQRDVDLSKSGDELIIRIGGFKKHLDLPRSFVSRQPARARIEHDSLWVYFQGGNSNDENEP